MRPQQIFNRREIDLLTEDLKIFLNAVKSPITKLDYFTTGAAELERIGSIVLAYQYEQIDIISEVENAVIRQLPSAEEKAVNIQLHLSPAAVMVYTDRLFFQQIFFRLLSTLLEAAGEKNFISVYVTDSDDKCIVELINRSEPVMIQAPEDYFKKYRITNMMPSVTEKPGDVLAVYKLLMKDMGGELAYSFEKDKTNYFRFKFYLR